MQNLHNFNYFSLFVAIGLIGCAQAESSATPRSAATPAQLSVDTLASEVFKINPTERAKRISALSKLSVLTYYQRLYAATTDAPLSLGEFHASGMRAAIRNAWPTLTALDEAYANMGTLWSAGGYDAKVTASQAEFASTLTSLILANLQGPTSLDLTDESFQAPSVPLPMPSTAQCAQSTAMARRLEPQQGAIRAARRA